MFPMLLSSHDTPILSGIWIRRNNITEQMIFFTNFSVKSSFFQTKKPHEIKGFFSNPLSKKVVFSFFFSIALLSFFVMEC